MSLLLDTHVLLELLAGEDDRFGTDTLDALREQSAIVSAATVWRSPSSGAWESSRRLRILSIRWLRPELQLLSVTAVHAQHVGELPDLHRDPFDRLLVSQAQLETLTLVTGDALVRSYEVSAVDPAA